MKFNRITIQNRTYCVTAKGFVIEYKDCSIFHRRNRRKTKSIMRDLARHVREHGGVLARVGK